ncbi:MAG: CinA family protein [Oscillospiraceae bacterium]|nr:CinA family protein [Oscillospiraceae bacterium]
MTSLAFEVIEKLNGKTLVTAESCTGGGIGAALTAVPGSSAVYKGGVVSYTDKVKKTVLGVDGELLKQYGAVSAPVAQAMAAGVRKLISASIAVSVTGLAGPGGDKFGNPVGTVFIGFESDGFSIVKQYRFSGDREAVRKQTVDEALKLILENA